MRVHQARDIGKRIQAPDIFNDGVCMPRGSAEPRTIAQLGFDIEIGKRVGETASRSHHGLAERFSRCQMDTDTRRAVRKRRVKLRPHLLAQ